MYKSTIRTPIEVLLKKDNEKDINPAKSEHSIKRNTNEEIKSKLDVEILTGISKEQK